MSAASELHFPGGVGVSSLRVYSWDAPDGIQGGSPHMHLVCTEGYLVREGHGAVQTITTSGYQEIPLRPGDVVAFSPGTIHRLVNDDARLRIDVIMQNDGLPEAGDAVLTYPPEHLTDRATYDAATSLLGHDSGRPDPERARARRDLAIQGFTRLRDAAHEGDPAPLAAFHQAACSLVAERLPEWRRRWQSTALRAAQATGEQIEALAHGDYTHLQAARTMRIPQPDGTALGMCGFLGQYPLRD